MPRIKLMDGLKNKECWYTFVCLLVILLIGLFKKICIVVSCIAELNL